MVSAERAGEPRGRGCMDGWVGEGNANKAGMDGMDAMKTVISLASMMMMMS
jgi:hypothetical protein